MLFNLKPLAVTGISLYPDYYYKLALKKVLPKAEPFDENKNIDY